jgi:hypothetical protein
MKTNNNNNAQETSIQLTAQESNTKIRIERCKDNDDQLQVKKVARIKILKFQLSGFSREELRFLKRFILIRKDSELLDEDESLETLDYLVCDGTERSLKVLYALILNIPIVTSEFILHCLNTGSYPGEIDDFRNETWK